MLTEEQITKLIIDFQSRENEFIRLANKKHAIDPEYWRGKASESNFVVRLLKDLKEGNPTLLD